MTRLSTFRTIKLNYVSSEALTVGVWTSPRERVCEGGAKLGFLARLGVWLRLIFGLGAPHCETIDTPHEDYIVNRSKRRAFGHRAKRRSSARKVPAHDLEMLMRFAPGARRGLTLNQFRERLTRISVLGRAVIYSRFLKRRLGRAKSVMVRRGFGQTSSTGRSDVCAAPLWPD